MPERPDRCGIAEHSPQSAIFAIFDVAKAVAVLDPRVPASDPSGPRADVVVHADLPPKYVAAPAIVIACDPKHRYAALDEVGESGEDPERRARNDRAPLEPKLEQVAVDHDRSGTAFEIAKKNEQAALDLAGRNAKMCV